MIGVGDVGCFDVVKVCEYLLGDVVEIGGLFV